MDRTISLFETESRRGLSLIGIPFGFSLLLLATPLLLIFFLGFWTQDYLILERSFSLENYIEAWTEPMYRDLMLRSLGISASVTFATVFLAYPMAYFISFYGGKRKALWIFLVTIPFWTSYLLRVFLWKVILGYNGVLNSSLDWLGLIEEPLTFILYNSNAVIITLTHAWAPFAILPIYVALEKIDRSYLEAATDLGDGPLKRFLRITLPLSMTGVVAASLIIFIPTIGDYVTPKLVGGKDGLMIANIIQVQFMKANNAPLGASLAVSAMGIVTVISVIFLAFNRRWLRKRGS
mgnify:FL=1|tara:strand:- start:206 stop:1084 length:879 start_codon:yes stop_codon:yes gene_type:complete